MNSLPTFNAILERRSARHFSSKKVNDQLLYELLNLANRAPSGFNLQPWHFIVVRDPTLKTLLAAAALGQTQLKEAPVCVAFVANPQAWKSSHRRIVAESLRAHTISPEYAVQSRNNVDAFFSLGPFGATGVLKRLGSPIRRFLRPSAPTLTSKQETVQYVRAQTMLAAATFMIAASGAGLSTCPMEGYDEERVKKLLAIPSFMSVALLIPIGYEIEGAEVQDSYRLPLDEKISVDLFPNALAKVRKA